MTRLPLAVLLAVAAGGCAHEYAYWPAAPGAPNSPAVRYPIPPEAPRGEVYVTSFGFTEMDVAADRSAAQLLHARLVAVNNGPEPWTMDGREQQLLVAPGQPMLTAAIANSDAGPGPGYVVPPGQRRVFDLYYDVPAPYNDPRQLGYFELVWRITAGGRALAERTPFTRFEGPPGGYYDPYPSYVFVGLGWGGLWWHAPFYPFAYPPVVRTYYYPPVRARTYGPWRGTPRTTPPSGGWRGSPPGGSGWRGSPPGGGGWRGSPPGGGGGRRR